ncbi:MULTISPECIES: replicative DNA helicase [Cytobacillus]|uniref:replicative DNA helicase n=1 Tax=Cytobacillus TaxID=2675230 RepID=UPI0025A17C57|nr:DnaB-like helicase C-terminal domain-containing protein [Cytobacillus kochii]MDM5208435.1 DnaB-like helicase C-terminal domain-containing protein [Cytobacillus kochii]
MHLIGASDLSAEQSVLGAIFLEQSVLDELTFLEERDFSSVRHQQIFKVMRYLEEKGSPVDIITVTDACQRFGGVELIGGVSYLTEVASSCPTAENASYYAHIVRSKAIERRTRNMGEIIAGLSRDDYDSDEEYFSTIERLVQEMRPQSMSKMQSFTETKASYFQHLDTPAEYIKTGFDQFDNWAKGLWRGWLFVSAGRPSVGKTAKMLQRLYGVAKEHKGVVLIFSQEMGANELKDRLMSCITGISYGRIKGKNLDEKEKGRLQLAYEGFEYLPFFIQDSPGVTIEQVKATAKQFKRKYGKIAAIAVDYLQIMNIPQKKGESRSQAIGNVTGQAKQLAREMDCCFYMLSQMSREFEKALKPQLSHLKESGSIEQDADVVEFLWHDPDDTAMGGKVIQQTIAKGRDIGLNEFRLLFQGWKQHFHELPKER